MKRLSLRTIQRRNSRLLIGLSLAFCAPTCAARASVPSTITLDGADITEKAAPMARGAVLLVNVSALAPPLGLRVEYAAGEWTLRDAEGAEWKTRSGQPFLEGNTRRLLSATAAQQGAALFLPIEAAAELAGAQFSVDASGIARLTLRKNEAVSGVADWQGFTLEKSASEQEAANDPASSGRHPAQFTPRLPASHDSMTVGLGFGYGQNETAGLELTGEGRYLGSNVRFASQLTPTASGLQLHHARLLWEDLAMGRAVEAGSLYSDLWGGVSGARYAWKAGKDHWPALSLYRSAGDASAAHTTLAFRDDIHLLRNVWVGGEAATDGSLYAQGRFHTRRLDGAFYARYLNNLGNSSGGLLSYDLGRGVSLYADMSHSADRNTRSDWRSIGLRLPVTRSIDVTLERAYSQTNSGSTQSDALTVSLPLGPVRLYTRYQWRTASVLNEGRGSAVFGLNSQEMQTSALYSINPRLRLELQMRGYGNRSGSQNVTTAYRLSNRTQMQFSMPFLQASGSDRYRFRLEHQLRRDLALTLDYGFAFASQTAPANGFGQGWSLTLRSHWTTATPTRGAEVRGEVQDAAGQPVRGAIAQLNTYQTQTDAKGRYVFRNVPAGEYELSLMENSLPADCKAAQSPLRLTLSEGSRKRALLKVLPLHSIAGRVFCEKSDGSAEAMDLNGIALSLDGFVTGTGKDGTFAFYNLTPGKHTVRLLAERLPEGFALNSPAELTVELPLDQSVPNLVFRLKRRDKEILFQDAP